MSDEALDLLVVLDGELVPVRLDTRFADWQVRSLIEARLRIQSMPDAVLATGVRPGQDLHRHRLELFSDLTVFRGALNRREDQGWAPIPSPFARDFLRPCDVVRCEVGAHVGIAHQRIARPSEKWFVMQAHGEMRLPVSKSDDWWAVLPFSGGEVLAPRRLLHRIRPATQRDLEALYMDAPPCARAALLTAGARAPRSSEAGAWYRGTLAGILDLDPTHL